MNIEDLSPPLQQWLLEQEGYHLRLERLCVETQSDTASRLPRLLAWLQVAYELGQRSACPVPSGSSPQTEAELCRCPLCGADKGYRLSEGSTFRWWSVQCAGCGQEVSECRSNNATQFDAPKPARWPAADEQWNSAGAHAQGLRTALTSLPGGAALLAGIDAEDSRHSPGLASEPSAKSAGNG